MRQLVGCPILPATRSRKLHQARRGTTLDECKKAREVEAKIQMATDGLTAVITGGTNGIGRAAANKLALLGLHVLIVGRNRERGEKAVAEIRTAGAKVDFIASACGMRRARAKFQKERSNSVPAASTS
jgi:lactate dehydrogenase-like 2-hydroxyacid dehydrogenase